MALHLSEILMGLSCGQYKIWHTYSTPGQQANVSLQCPDSLTMLMQIQWAPRMALGECRQIEQVSLSTPPQDNV